MRSLPHCGRPDARAGLLPRACPSSAPFRVNAGTVVGPGLLRFAARRATPRGNGRSALQKRIAIFAAMLAWGVAEAGVAVAQTVYIGPRPYDARAYEPG